MSQKASTDWSLFQTVTDYVSFYVSCNLGKVAGMVQSVEQLATDWTGEGANNGESVIFCACPNRNGGRPSLLHNGGSSAAGGGVDDHSPPYRTDVK
jgi:hypothetical protein